MANYVEQAALEQLTGEQLLAVRVLGMGFSHEAIERELDRRSLLGRDGASSGGVETIASSARVVDHRAENFNAAA